MAESAVGEEGHQAAVSRGQPCALPGTVLRPPLARKKWPLPKKSKMQPTPASWVSGVDRKEGDPLLRPRGAPQGLLWEQDCRETEVAEKKAPNIKGQ